MGVVPIPGPERGVIPPCEGVASGLGVAAIPRRGVAPSYPVPASSSERRGVFSSPYNGVWTLDIVRRLRASAMILSATRQLFSSLL
jgi:hypothetical protein